MAVIGATGPRNRVIGLISAGHFYSHFCVLMLPPLFPLLKDGFGVSYALLGSAIAAFGAATGAGQIPMGFLVDRIGGRRVLVLGIALMGSALALTGLTTAYWQLLALYAVAGLGNSVFHPADYAILSARIDEGHTGRAFSVHTFSGYLGWTAAPPAMLGLIAVMDWRWAITCVGVLGLGLALTLAFHGRLLDGPDAQPAPPPGPASRADGGGLRQGMALMGSMPMAMMFLFFLLTATAGSGLMSFAVVAAMSVFGADLVAANAVLTGYLFAGALGVLLGGWIADRIGRHNLVTSIAILAMAAVLVAIGFGVLSVLAMIGAMSLAGLLYGIASPSRDMLVRAVTPAGSIGVAFGFTATGFSIGNSIAPVLFGWVMDQGWPSLLFTAAGAIMAVSIITVVATRTGRGKAPS